MIALSELWQPILLSAVIVWIASALVWVFRVTGTIGWLWPRGM